MKDPISSDDGKLIIESFLKAFDTAHFTLMLQIELGVNLDHEVGTDNGLRIILGKIIRAAQEGGWLEKLLVAAQRYRPLNEHLSNLNHTLLVRDSTAGIEAFVQPHISQIDNNTVDVALERFVNERAPSLPFTEFTERLLRIGQQICLIEIPLGSPKGTGWLVGPDLVLTAYHVIKKVNELSNGYSSSDIACRFDYIARNNKPRYSGPKVSLLADDWLVDYSPYALADIGKSQVEPTDNELDYALIRLSSKVGEEELSLGHPRGWIKVPENPTVIVQSKDLMCIPQHPEGRPLELAFGQVLGYNNNSNRLRYNTNTDPGSSGAPCFDISLAPFGLHHAAGPSEGDRFNQCIPLRSIIRSMKRHLVDAFWSI